MVRITDFRSVHSGSNPGPMTNLNNNITENITIHVLTIGERRKNESWDRKIT